MSNIYLDLSNLTPLLLNNSTQKSSDSLRMSNILTLIDMFSEMSNEACKLFICQQKFEIYFPLYIMPINNDRNEHATMHTKQWHNGPHTIRMSFRHTALEICTNIWANESEFMAKCASKLRAKFSKRNWNRKLQELKFTLCPQSTERVAKWRSSERRRRKGEESTQL